MTWTYPLANNVRKKSDNAGDCPFCGEYYPAMLALHVVNCPKASEEFIRAITPTASECPVCNPKGDK